MTPYCILFKFQGNCHYFYIHSIEIIIKLYLRFNSNLTNDKRSLEAIVKLQLNI